MGRHLSWLTFQTHTQQVTATATAITPVIEECTLPSATPRSSIPNWQLHTRRSKQITLPRCTPTGSPTKTTSKPNTQPTPPLAKGWRKPVNRNVSTQRSRTELPTHHGHLRLTTGSATTDTDTLTLPTDMPAVTISQSAVKALARAD